VYVQESITIVANTLQVKARPNILRVVEVRPGGAVVLQGKCGTTTHQNITNLAPCHLPGIDPSIDVTLQHVPVDHVCEVCRFPDKESRMLLCDNCNTGWHLDCLTPKLTVVPEGAWICPYCVTAGVELGEVAARQIANERAKLASGKHVAPQFTRQRQRFLTSFLAEAQVLHRALCF
jgi:hypothetical protein